MKLIKKLLIGGLTSIVAASVIGIGACMYRNNPRDLSSKVVSVTRQSDDKPIDVDEPTLEFKVQTDQKQIPESQQVHEEETKEVIVESFKKITIDKLQEKKSNESSVDEKPLITKVQRPTTLELHSEEESTTQEVLQENSQNSDTTKLIEQVPNKEEQPQHRCSIIDTSNNITQEPKDATKVFDPLEVADELRTVTRDFCKMVKMSKPPNINITEGKRIIEEANVIRDPIPPMTSIPLIGKSGCQNLPKGIKLFRPILNTPNYLSSDSYDEVASDTDIEEKACSIHNTVNKQDITHEEFETYKNMYKPYVCQLKDFHFINEDEVQFYDLTSYLIKKTWRFNELWPNKRIPNGYEFPKSHWEHRECPWYVTNDIFKEEHKWENSIFKGHITGDQTVSFIPQRMQIVMVESAESNVVIRMGVRTLRQEKKNKDVKDCNFLYGAELEIIGLHVSTYVIDSTLPNVRTTFDTTIEELKQAIVNSKSIQNSNGPVTTEDIIIANINRYPKWGKIRCEVIIINNKAFSLYSSKPVSVRCFGEVLYYGFEICDGTFIRTIDTGLKNYPVTSVNAQLLKDIIISQAAIINPNNDLIGPNDLIINSFVTKQYTGEVYATITIKNYKATKDGYQPVEEKTYDDVRFFNFKPMIPTVWTLDRDNNVPLLLLDGGNEWRDKTVNMFDDLDLKKLIFENRMLLYPHIDKDVTLDKFDIRILESSMEDGVVRASVKLKEYVDKNGYIIKPIDPEFYLGGLIEIDGFRKSSEPIYVIPIHPDIH